MHSTWRSPCRLAAVGLLVLGAIALPRPGLARSTFFASRCASCHTNDTQTCNGCHHHRGGLAASCDRTSYYPGEPVSITFQGGSQRGWIRALLYDQTNTQVDRLGGPTSMGDDGLGNAVAFPLSLKGTAPAQPGNYTWQAAWFGNSGDGGPAHGEVRTSVVVHVVPFPTAVERSAWDRIKSLYR